MLNVLGVNPLATITALAERSVALVAEESGLEVDLETPNADIDADSTPRVSHFKNDLGDEEFVSTGWQFTEALEGYVSVPGGSSFEVSEREGKGSSSAIRMLLTVGIRRKVQSTCMDDALILRSCLHLQAGRDIRVSALGRYPAVLYHDER